MIKFLLILINFIIFSIKIRSTWNILIIFSLLALTSCKKDDPTPELSDKIYADIIANESDANKRKIDMEKLIEEHKIKLRDSRPQTGDAKRISNKIFQQQNELAKVEQQVLYWKIRRLERVKYVRMNKPKFQEADWIKKIDTELQIYLSEKKLRQAKNSWDLKERFREGGFQYNPVLMGEGIKPESTEGQKTSGH